MNKNEKRRKSAISFLPVLYSSEFIHQANHRNRFNGRVNQQTKEKLIYLKSTEKRKTAGENVFSSVYFDQKFIIRLIASKQRHFDGK